MEDLKTLKNEEIFESLRKIFRECELNGLNLYV